MWIESNGTALFQIEPWVFLEGVEPNQHTLDLESTVSLIV